MATFRKRGSRWHVQVRRKGTPSLTRSFETKSDAEIWARRFERRIDLGEIPNDHSNHEKQVRLQELLIRYAEEVSVRKRGAEAEMYRVNAIAARWIGRCYVRQLNSQMLSRYRDERLKCVVAASVLAELSLIRHCLHLAKHEWGIVSSEDIFQNFRFPTPSKARDRRLENGELEAMVDGCERGRSPLLAPVIRFAIETGMRRGEIVNVRWEDIDFETSTLHIPITKNGHSRTIPLTEEAGGILKALPSANERVFPVSGNAIRLAWDRLKRRVGIEDLHFHDLRHEAISRFFEMGLSVPEVALISGHRDYRMLFRYTHLRAEDVAKKLAGGVQHQG